MFTITIQTNYKKKRNNEIKHQLFLMLNISKHQRISICPKHPNQSDTHGFLDQTPKTSHQKVVNLEKQCSVESKL